MKILSDEEIKKLVAAQCLGSKSGSVPQDEVIALIEWAQKTRIDATFLELILKGAVSVTWKDGEPCLHPLPK